MGGGGRKENSAVSFSFFFCLLLGMPNLPGILNKVPHSCISSSISHSSLPCPTTTFNYFSINCVAVDGFILGLQGVLHIDGERRQQTTTTALAVDVQKKYRFKMSCTCNIITELIADEEQDHLVEARSMYSSFLLSQVYFFGGEGGDRRES